MNSTNSDEAAGSTEPTEGADSLARAAEQGPMDWDDAAGDHPDGSDPEPAVLHDSPASVDEDRAENPSPGDNLDRPDSMSSIYGPPAGAAEGKPS